MDPRAEVRDGRPTVAEDFDAEEERRRRQQRWSFPYRQLGDSQGRTPGQEGFDPVSASERQHGLPQNLLQNIWTVESGRGQSMLGPVTRSGERARGHFQFMPRTGAQYGLRSDEDFNDLGRSSVAAGRYMRDLIEWFKGDLRAATAAYNYGPGNVGKLMGEKGDKWEQFLPAETRAYLDKVFGSRAPTQVQVRIENQTGGSPVVTQNVTVAQ
jgi:soluble lytic murein transglycosylase-like protein